MPERCYTLGDLKRIFGVGVRQIQYLHDIGKLPNHPKVGNYRVVYESDLPRCLEVFREAGYLLSRGPAIGE